MLIKTGKAVAPQPQFELQLPTDFVLEPKWKVFLPLNQAAHIYEAMWHIESEDKATERVVNGFRVEIVDRDGTMRNEHKFRYKWEVVRHLVKTTRELLRDGADDEDDDDDDGFTPVPKSLRKA